MPEIKTSVISKEDASEIIKMMKENALTIIWGVLTAAALLAAAKYYPEYLVLAIPILTAAASLLISRYQNLKNKVKELRIAVDAMDDALADNTVTVEEIRDIFLKIRKLLLR
jgi:hypothetical protein